MSWTLQARSEKAQREAREEVRRNTQLSGQRRPPASVRTRPEDGVGGQKEQEVWKELKSMAGW